MWLAEATISDCLHLIRARYFKSPDLRLTKREVRQLWCRDPVTCDALLDALIDIRFLRRTREGVYVRERTG